MIRSFNQPKYFLWNKFLVHCLLLDPLYFKNLVVQGITFEIIFFIICLLWPSLYCLIHFILMIGSFNKPKYFLWNKFLVYGLSIWPSFYCLIHFFLRIYYSKQPRYLLWYFFIVCLFRPSPNCLIHFINCGQRIMPSNCFFWGVGGF